MMTNHSHRRMADSPRTAPIAEFERWLTHRLSLPLPGPHAQWRFAPTPAADDWAPDLTPATARRAAALILVHPGPEGLAVPLTVRHSGLPQHGGQVSLPGGAIDPGESPASAALREAEEEIGVPADHVRLLGQLSPLWIAVSNFIVYPFVGLTDITPGFRVHPAEVAELIDVPLHELRDRERLKWARRERREVEVDYPYFDLKGKTVWGATAMMLGEFACLFDETHAPGERR
jgi:8-oxo-dGTP pyrophosphatase MutT (NUDIX family)